MATTNRINMQNCCCPRGCVVGEPIDANEPDDAIAMICTSNECTSGRYMHKVCFDGFEQYALSALHQQARMRGWSDKQRTPNVWSKRGYDLCYRACACTCQRGYLKKRDNATNNATVKPHDDESTTKKQQQRRQRRHSSSKMQQPSSFRTTDNNSPPFARPRWRTASLGSAAGLADSNATSTGAKSTTHSNGFFDDVQVKSTGSIFQRRVDAASLLDVLPRWKFNGVQVKLEDDCPQGNDDMRIFLLSNLGAKNLRQIPCVLCAAPLCIYDRYPLINGTFFLSPHNHRTIGMQVRYEGKDAYLLAICVQCLEHSSDRLACNRCQSTSWFPGKQLIVGGLYTYDVLSTVACCPPQCAECHRPIVMSEAMRVGLLRGDFSVFSEVVVCSACGAKGPAIRRTDTFHLVDKPGTDSVDDDDETTLVDQQQQFRTAIGNGLMKLMECDDEDVIDVRPMVVARN